MNVVTLDDLKSIEYALNISLSKFITFSSNYCGYTFKTHDLVLNWVHTMFIKSKAAASNEDNPNWWEAISGLFED